MAMKLAATVAVKMIDSQRCACRIHWFQFNSTSLRKLLSGLGQNLLKPSQELLPAVLGAAVSLLLI